MSHTVVLALPSEEDFDPAQTLDCGQAFRFRECPDGSFEGVAGRRSCRVRKSGREIRIDCSCDGGCEGYWNDYFDLGRDYGRLKRDFASEPTLSDAVSAYPGIRVLRQEPWEALCTFLFSSCNNIPRIKKLVEALCALCGTALPDGKRAFPTPEAVASLSDAERDSLRAGYRAAYLRDAAEKVLSGEVDLAALRTLPLPEARAMLRRIRGVGPKVAECVLLYGCGRVGCLPVDVWIQRVLTEYYPDGFPEQFSAHAGIAQQFLFHYIRNLPSISPAR